MLHEFIIRNRDRIIAHARAKVAQRPAPRPTEEELESGVPIFLTQLIHVLAPSAESTKASKLAPASGAASARGGELLRRGFTVGQVVHDYGEICQAITTVAAEDNLLISALEFRSLNQALDDAVAFAVTEYTRQRERQIALEESERMAVFADELGKLVSSARLAFEVVQRGAVGASGSTGSLVGRSLSAIHELVGRNLALLRLELGPHTSARFPLAMLLEEIEIGAIVDAKERSVRLTIASVDTSVEISADQQILAAAVENLISGAVRHTRTGGEIDVRVVVDDATVKIEIADECGGLQAGQEATMLAVQDVEPGPRKTITHRLEMCRRAVEACNGRLSVRSQAGKGCIFTVSLPRSPRLN